MSSLAKVKTAAQSRGRPRTAARLLAKNKATASLAAYVDALRQEPLIVTSNGAPVAVLVAVAGADAETIALSTSPAFMRIIARSRRRYRDAGGVSSAELRRQLGAGKRKLRARPQTG